MKQSVTTTLLVLFASILVVGAETTFKVSASLEDPLINADSVFKIYGVMNDGSIQPGDCIKITKEQPYTQSKTDFSGSDPFYVPFPAGTYSMGSDARPTATV